MPGYRRPIESPHPYRISIGLLFHILQRVVALEPHLGQVGLCSPQSPLVLGSDPGHREHENMKERGLATCEKKSCLTFDLFKNGHRKLVLLTRE